MKVRIGLVGYGNWAREAYVPALLDDGEVEIGAVAARSEATRRLASERFGAGAALFDDPMRLVREAGVDAVMIGLPPELVAEVASAAMETGRHAWVEPPPPGDARIAGLLDAAGRSGLVFHADMELRYHPVVAAVRGLLDERLGPALAVRVVQRCNWAMTWDEGAVERGGMASGLSIWYLDPIDALLDRQPRRVDVMGARPRFERAVEAGSALVEYDGAVGEWSFNLRSPERLSLRLEVAALEGEAEADLLTGRYRYRAGSTGWVEGDAPPAQPAYGFVGMRECVAAFLGAVRGEGRSLTGPGVLRRVHATTTAFDESVGSGNSAEVSDYRLESDPRFLRRVAEARRSLRRGEGVALEDVDEARALRGAGWEGDLDEMRTGRLP